MESKLLNLMLYRQSLLIRHLSRSIKELGMQLEIQKTFITELKDATDYFNSEFGKNELNGFPVELKEDVSCYIDNSLFNHLNETSKKEKPRKIPKWEQEIMAVKKEEDPFVNRHPLECQE